MSPDKKGENMITPDKKGEDECLLDKKSGTECLLHDEGEVSSSFDTILNNDEEMVEMASEVAQIRSAVNKTVKKNKTFKTKKSKKLLFRERNGAAYQNPKDASSNEGSSDIDPDDFEVDNKTKHYTLTQRIVSSKLRKAIVSIGKQYPIDKTWFNRKHLKEIFSDKETLLSWYEYGVASRAISPNPLAESCSGPQPRQMTLDEFCTSNRLEALKISKYLPQEQREQLEKATSEYVRTIMGIDVDADEDPFWCQDKCPMYFAQGQMEKHLDKNPQDRPKVPGLKIPLCIHAVKYFAGNLYRELYVEATNMLPSLPRDQLPAFAEAVCLLTSAVEILRDDNKIFGLHYCNGPTCDWQTSINRSAANVAASRGGSYQHLGLNPKDIFELTLRKNRFSQEFRKTENREETSVDILSYYVERIYRSAALLVDSLPEFEARFLKKEIKAFVNAARDMVYKEKSPELLQGEPNCLSWLGIKAQRSALHQAMYDRIDKDMGYDEMPRSMSPVVSRLLVTLDESKLQPAQKETAAEACLRIARLVLPLIDVPNSFTDSSSDNEESPVIRLSNEEIERIVSENTITDETNNVTQELDLVALASHSESEEAKL